MAWIKKKWNRTIITKKGIIPYTTDIAKAQELMKKENAGKLAISFKYPVSIEMPHLHSVSMELLFLQSLLIKILYLSFVAIGECYLYYILWFVYHVINVLI